MNIIKRHIHIASALTLLSALVVGCHGSNGEDPAAAAQTLERALAPREVRLLAPEVREERPAVELVGEIRPFDTVTVSSEIAGKADRRGGPAYVPHLPATGRSKPRRR
jgi:hypothetical protein